MKWSKLLFVLFLHLMSSTTCKWICCALNVLINLFDDEVGFSEVVWVEPPSVEPLQHVIWQFSCEHILGLLILDCLLVDRVDDQGDQPIWASRFWNCPCPSRDWTSEPCQQFLDHYCHSFWVAWQALVILVFGCQVGFPDWTDLLSNFFPSVPWGFASWLSACSADLRLLDRGLREWQTAAHVVARFCHFDDHHCFWLRPKHCWHCQGWIWHCFCWLPSQ